MNILNILKIIRVHIVVGGFLAFLLGVLLAIVEGGNFDYVRFIVGYFVVFLADLSTHYGNDYFDVEVDQFINKRKFFAGSGILVNNPDLRYISKIISIILLAGSNLLGAIGVFYLGFPIEFFVIILTASLLGWFYSSPPVRLVSRGFGEVIVGFVTGFAIPGLGYLAIRGQFDPLFFYFVIPCIMYGLTLSLSLHAPDIEVDQRGNKRNLSVRLGQRRIFLLIFAMVFSATLAFCIYAIHKTFFSVNFTVIASFSFVPLIAGLVGFIGFFQNKVNYLSTLNVGALFVFNIVMIVYLLLTAVGI